MPPTRASGSAPARRRLPRAIESDPRCDEVRVALATSNVPLWSRSDVVVPSVVDSPAVRSALQAASAAGQLERGLETVAAALDGEARGLFAAGLGDADRVSRLLIVSDDGSERFYRQVERLLRAHGDRVLVLRVRCSASALGELLFGPDATAKAVAVSRKSAVAAVLLALASGA
jgi:hypothetical protein